MQDDAHINVASVAMKDTVVNESTVIEDSEIVKNPLSVEDGRYWHCRLCWSIVNHNTVTCDVCLLQGYRIVPASANIPTNTVLNYVEIYSSKQWINDFGRLMNNFFDGILTDV